MSAKPYTAEEVEWLRGPKYDFNPIVVPIHDRWLATVDALRAQRDEAVGLLRRSGPSVMLSTLADEIHAFLAKRVRP